MFLSLSDEKPATAAQVAALTALMEKVMSQLDELNSILAAIHTDVTSLLEKASTLEDQLTQLQQTTPPQVDLSAAIAAAQEIRSQLEGTAATTGGATGADTSAPADTGSSPDTGTVDQPASDGSTTEPGPDQGGADAAPGDQSGTDATA